MKNPIRTIFFSLVFTTAFYLNYARTINVKDFGARGNGISDDRRAIQMAINAASPDELNTIYFPAGIYQIGSYSRTKSYLENYMLLLHNNLLIKGEGQKTIIRTGDHLFDKPDSGANAHLFFGMRISNIFIRDLQIDMNGNLNRVPKNFLKNSAALFLSFGHMMYMKNVTIKNCSGTNAIIIKDIGSNARIENCRFFNGGNYLGNPLPNKYQIDFSFIYSEWDSTIVTGTRIEQLDPDIALMHYSGGIELHGSFSEATENKITGCYPAIYITSSKDTLKFITIKKNIITKCLKGVSFWLIYPMNNISILNNVIELTHKRLIDPGNIVGIEIPNGNVSTYNVVLANAAMISQCSITGNRISSTLSDTSFDKSMGMILHSLQNSKIENNTISGMNYAGIMLLGSKWGINRLMINNNRFMDFKPNNSEKGVAGYFVITDTYTQTDPTAPGFRDISINNNSFIRNKTSGTSSPKLRSVSRGKFLGSFVALPEAMLKEIKFKNNSFKDATEKVVSVKTD